MAAVLAARWSVTSSQRQLQQSTKSQEEQNEGQNEGQRPIFSAAFLRSCCDRVNSFEAGEDYLHLANQLSVNYSTARNIIWVWMQDG